MRLNICTSNGKLAKRLCQESNVKPVLFSFVVLNQGWVRLGEVRCGKVGCGFVGFGLIGVFGLLFE